LFVFLYNACNNFLSNHKESNLLLEALVCQEMVDLFSSYTIADYSKLYARFVS
jgi:hypothetical protein